MLGYDRKLLLVMTFFTIESSQQAKKDFSYTIKKQFQSMVKAINFDNNTIRISSNFSLAPFPYVIIFIPTDRVRDPQNYAHTVNQFLENFSIPYIDDKPISMDQKVFFLMSQTSDAKSSTKRNWGEILAQFIEWLYSYNKNCTIILISDRNGNSIVNHASHITTQAPSPAVHTIIQLYPTIPVTATNQIEQALHIPNANYQKDIFIMYSDHVNTFTNKRGQKSYPSNVPHRSCLPLHDNEQIAPEEFLSTFCAKRLWPSLQKMKLFYPNHKNAVVYWSSDNKDFDQTCFLKDKELSYSPISLSKRPLVEISQERSKSSYFKKELETFIKTPIKVTLPLSEQSKYFYDTMGFKE